MTPEEKREAISKSVQKRIAAQKGLPDPFTKQAQIDLICKWMGWYKVEGRTIVDGTITYYWDWYKAERWMANSSFDSFTSPGDCARVMDEIRQQKWNYGTHYDAETQRPNKHSAWLEKDGQDYDMTSGESEEEAKMMAVLQMVKAQ